MIRKKSKQKSFLWITDPWATLDHPKDTTLRLIQEAIALGHACFWSCVHSIRWESDKVVLDAQRILGIGPDRLSDSFSMTEAKAMNPWQFSSVHYRVDPPVDLAFLQPLQILAMSPSTGKKVPLVNPIEVLLHENEKLEGAYLGKWMPPCVVTSQWEPILCFGMIEKKTVLKPLFEAQSKGVELLEWNTPAQLEAAKKVVLRSTEDFCRPVVVQKYLPGIHKGEQRLWFLDGKLLVAARKLPKSGEFRINMDQGGSVMTTKLSAKEKLAAKAIAKRLKELKIRLAAVDLIDGYVTDFNFTSPGLIVQIEKAYGENFARKIMQALARSS